MKVCWGCKTNKARNYGSRCKKCTDRKCVDCGAVLVVLIRFNDDLQTLNLIKVCPNEWKVARLRPEWRIKPEKPRTKRMKTLNNIFKELALAI